MGLQPCPASAGEKTDPEQVLRPHWEAWARGPDFLIQAIKLSTVHSTCLGCCSLGRHWGNWKGQRNKAMKSGSVFQSPSKAHTDAHTHAHAHTVSDLDHLNEYPYKLDECCHNALHLTLQVETCYKLKVYHRPDSVTKIQSWIPKLTSTGRRPFLH